MNDDAFYEYHYYTVVQIDRYYRYCTFSPALFSAFEGKDPNPSTENGKFKVPTVFTIYRFYHNDISRGENYFVLSVVDFVCR